MTSKPKSGTTTKNASYEGFADAEREAMKERAKELKAAAKGGKAAAAEAAVLEKIAEMPESDRVIAERIHAIVTETAPELTPKLWYGMPTYAKDGTNVCFFQAAAKFDTRYPTLGFEAAANLDDGTMWPTSFAIIKLTAANEKLIAGLVKKAVS